MMHRGRTVAMRTAVLFILLCGIPGAATFAYSIGSNSTETSSPQSNFNFSDGFGQLMTPFENFFTSIEQSNQTTINTHGSLPPPPDMTVHAGDVVLWLQNVDAWIYQTTGFKPSTVLAAVFNTLAWLYFWLIKQF